MKKQMHARQDFFSAEGEPTLNYAQHNKKSTFHVTTNSKWPFSATSFKTAVLLHTTGKTQSATLDTTPIQACNSRRFEHLSLPTQYNLYRLFLISRDKKTFISLAIFPLLHRQTEPSLPDTNTHSVRYYHNTHNFFSHPLQLITLHFYLFTYSNKVEIYLFLTYLL